MIAGCVEKWGVWGAGDAEKLHTDPSAGLQRLDTVGVYLGGLVYHCVLDCIGKARSKFQANQYHNISTTC